MSTEGGTINSVSPLLRWELRGVKSDGDTVGQQSCSEDQVKAFVPITILTQARIRARWTAAQIGDITAAN